MQQFRCPSSLRKAPAVSGIRPGSLPWEEAMEDDGPRHPEERLARGVRVRHRGAPKKGTRAIGSIPIIPLEREPTDIIHLRGESNFLMEPEREHRGRIRPMGDPEEIHSRILDAHG